MPQQDLVKQTSAYLRMLLLRPGEYRNKWERASTGVDPGSIDYDAVARVLTTGVDGPAPDARAALEGTALDEPTLGRFIEAFALSARHSSRLWNLLRGSAAVRVIS